MDRDYAIIYLKNFLKITPEAAEEKLDRMIEVYAPELDALRPEIDSILTSADEEYFYRIVNNG